jgi:hypothetical protein
MPIVPIEQKYEALQYTGSNSAEIVTVTGITIVSEVDDVLTFTFDGPREHVANAGEWFMLAMHYPRFSGVFTETDMLNEWRFTTP